MLYDLAGADIPNDLSDVEPASELLVMAVACLGAPLSAHPAVTLPLFDQCQALAMKPGYLDSSETALDSVEAVNLLESAVRIPQLLGRSEARALASTPFKLELFGRGTAVALALYHQLNVVPSLGESHPEYERRQALFWILWELDAIRMVSSGVPCRLADLNIGWEHGPGVLSDPHLKLARVARQISSAVLSARAQAQGICEDGLTGALSALDDLNTPVEMDGGLETLPSEQLFFQTTRNLLYLVCWLAVKNSELHVQLEALLEAAALRATERMALLSEAITKHDLFNTVPCVVRDHMVAFILFIVRKLATAETTSAEAELYSTLAGSLCRAVGSATAYGDSERLASVLNEAVYLAREQTRPVTPDYPTLQPDALPSAPSRSAPVFGPTPPIPLGTATPLSSEASNPSVPGYHELPLTTEHGRQSGLFRDGTGLVNLSDLAAAHSVFNDDGLIALLSSHDSWGTVNPSL